MAGNLEQEFLDRAARRSPGVNVFEPAVAIEIAEEAKRRGVRTFGLDAFILHPGNAIQPDMEYDLTLPGCRGDHDKVIDHLRRFVGTSYFFVISTD